MITVEVKNQQEEKPKDIFFNGNIVKSNTLIVLVSLNYSCEENYFSGAVLESIVGSFNRGDHYSQFNKASFTQFTGTITITSK